MKLVERTLEATMIQRPEPTADQPQNMCLDKGYDYPLGAWRSVKSPWGYTGHMRSRGEERVDKGTIPGYRARRWVVERTHSWLNRFRRLLIRWEKKVENYVAMLRFRLRLDYFPRQRGCWIGS